jgi:hypothetical protein
VRRFLWDVDFKGHAELGEQLEDEAELRGRLAVLDIRGELLAHARGRGEVVDSDVTASPHGADGEP